VAFYYLILQESNGFTASTTTSVNLSGKDILGLEASNIPWIVVAPDKKGLQFKVYETAS
jgi:hypothetical protein